MGTHCSILAPKSGLWDPGQGKNWTKRARAECTDIPVDWHKGNSFIHFCSCRTRIADWFLHLQSNRQGFPCFKLEANITCAEFSLLGCLYSSCDGKCGSCRFHCSTVINPSSGKSKGLCNNKHQGWYETHGISTRSEWAVTTDSA